MQRLEDLGCGRGGERCDYVLFITLKWISKIKINNLIFNFSLFPSQSHSESRDLIRK